MRGIKTGGRKQGTPNKVTSSAREAIELTFEGLGGIAALTTWAKDNQTDFYARIWPKLLPLQISGDPANPHSINVAVTNKEPSSTMEWLRGQIEAARKQREKAESEAANPPAQDRVKSETQTTSQSGLRQG